jgi:hypothetical protein
MSVPSTDRAGSDDRSSGTGRTAAPPGSEDWVPAGLAGWVWYGWVGVLLIAVAWPLNWGVGIDGLRTHLLFFPLWLGYILVVDALVLRRRGTSLMTRSPRGFGALFVASAPAWWLFEAINLRTQNWTFVGAEQFDPVTYGVLASVAFSTVMPAVFESAELVRSFDWTERWADGPRLAPTPLVLRTCIGLGVVSIVLPLIWPTYFYPLIWGAAFFLVVPINAWRGRPTLLDATAQGNWRPVVALALGSLLCGIFWELWNAYAYPKWVYDAPGVNFAHVFEMPALGFIGYLPMAWELHALAQLTLPAPPDLRL